MNVPSERSGSDLNREERTYMAVFRAPEPRTADRLFSICVTPEDADRNCRSPSSSRSWPNSWPREATSRGPTSSTTSAMPPCSYSRTRTRASSRRWISERPCRRIRSRWGFIAAQNAMSDVYAVGGTPSTALSILGWPSGGIAGLDIHEIFAGALAAVTAASVSIVGGHSLISADPVLRAVCDRVRPQGGRPWQRLQQGRG